MAITQQHSEASVSREFGVPVWGWQRYRRVLAALLTGVLALVGTTGCSKGEASEASKRINLTIEAEPAPRGWINSKDGAFRIELPPNYLDAYEVANGKDLPDAQVILSMPANMALNGYIPALVIDHAQATNDPDAVETALKEDSIYQEYTNFTVMHPVKVEGMNVMQLKWNYVYQEVAMTAFLTMVSANNYAYALKQDVPDYALETYHPIIDKVLGTWTWNEKLL